MNPKEIAVGGTPLRLKISKIRNYYLAQVVGSSNPLLHKIADNTLRYVRYGYNIGSIDLYRASWLEEEVNVFISGWEVAYLTLSTESGLGIWGPINEATTEAAIRRLEVEMSRVAKEFYQIAVDLEHDMAALDLILLLKKGSELSSRLP